MRVVDQLRDGARGVGDRIAALPSSAGRAAGRARRTVTDLPSRVADRVRGDSAPAKPAAAAPVDGDRLIDRARENPGYAIAIAGGGLLLFLWIAWAIYVTSEHGTRAGLGVVLSWPVLLGALILVALPFYGVFLLVRRIREGGFEWGGDSSGSGDAPAGEAEEGDKDEDSEEDEPDEDSDEDEPDEDSDEDEESEDEDEEDDSEEDEDASAEAEEDESEEEQDSDEDEDGAEKSPKAGSSAGS